MIKPRYFSIDYETTPFKESKDFVKPERHVLDFKLACMYECDKDLNIIDKLSFTDFDKMIDWMCDFANADERKIFYFYNLNFDSKFFFSEMRDRFDVKEIPCNNGTLLLNCYQKDIKKRKIRIIFKDMKRILLGSIKELGKLINLPKLDFDYEYDFNDKEKIDKAIEYCFRDAEIPLKALRFFLDIINNNFNINFNLKNIPLTIASISKKIFQKFYPNVFYKHDSTMEKYLRKYYFGGRVEVFNFNKLINMVYLDVHSLYPYALSNFTFAKGRVRRYRFFGNIKRVLKDKEIIAFECELKEKNELIYYPERDFQTNKIMFKKGVKKALLGVAEYKLVKNDIEILSINAIYTCKKRGNFKKHFKKCYDIRKNNKENILEYAFKIIPNSLYGKFGQKPERKTYEYVDDYTDDDLVNKRVIEIADQFMIIHEKMQWFQTVNLLNAVLTCNYARLILYKMLKFCEQKKVLVSYCDTDCVFVPQNELIKLKKFIGVKLGQWGIETIFDWVQAIDSKEYFFERNKEFGLKFKGLKADNFTLDDLKNHYQKGSLNLMIPSPRYCLKRNDDERTTYIIQKQKHDYYCKRIINNDLTTTTIGNENLQEIMDHNQKLIFMKILKIDKIKKELSEYQIKVIRNKLKKANVSRTKRKNYYDMPLIDVPSKLKQRMIEQILKEVYFNLEAKFGYNFIINLDDLGVLDIDDGLTYYENIEVLSTKFNSKEILEYL